MVIAPLTVPRLVTALTGLPVTFSIWLMTPPGKFVIDWCRLPETVTSVVERTGVADRVLAAGDAEGLVDGGPAPIGNGVGAVSDGEAVVERAGVVDRVLAAGNAEDLIDETA